jgi:hypothetical protein
VRTEQAAGAPGQREQEGHAACVSRSGAWPTGAAGRMIRASSRSVRRAQAAGARRASSMCDFF